MVRRLMTLTLLVTLSMLVQKAATRVGTLRPQRRPEMTTCLTLRRLSALTLAVTLALASAPLPAYAAQQETAVPAGPRSVLTLGGQPISPLTALGAILTEVLEPVSHPPATRPARQPTAGSRDPLWNGIAIGAEVGAKFGLKLAEIDPFIGGPTTDAQKFRGVLLTTAFGAGIGALVDAIR